MIQYLGLWILALLTMNMWALLSVLASDAGLRSKGVWAAFLLALPGVGFFGWYLVGPRRTKT